jgi:hypothetical protein
LFKRIKIRNEPIYSRCKSLCGSNSASPGNIKLIPDPTSEACEGHSEAAAVGAGSGEGGGGSGLEVGDVLPCRFDTVGGCFLSCGDRYRIVQSFIGVPP